MLPFGDQYLDNELQFVHVDDMARLIAYLVRKPEPESQRLTVLNVAGSGEPLTVALIDIDRFKSINDNFSHAVGDAVLRRVAGIIRDQCRQHDLPVRYGGDEFLLVLAGADLALGARVLGRLKETVDAWPWAREAPGLKVTLSIGIASRPAGATIASTIAAADEALYHAKAAGRNRIATKG